MSAKRHEPEQKKALVLHIEVPDIYADDLPDLAAIWAEGLEDHPIEEHMRDVVLYEWFRDRVVLGLVTIPGDKCTNDEFEVLAREGRIVGASVKDRT